MTRPERVSCPDPKGMRAHFRNSGLTKHKACGCARSTVQDVARLAAEKGVGWDDVAALTERQAHELLRGTRAAAGEGYAKIDFERVSREMARDRTMTLSLLWEEYAASAARNGERPYMYSRFCESYRKWCESHDVAMTRRYVPGDLGEFDWAGQTMRVVDPDTGEASEAWLFVACLPYSQKAFVKAMPDTRTESWCAASADAFEFYGGVPRLLTIDNLKTGVTRHAYDEIVLNRTYQEFAEHYNVAVIPHAPGRPRDKNSVESSVDKFADRVRNALRDRTLFGLDELNEAMALEVAKLNARPLQKRAGSRDEKFEAAERGALQPLPASRFVVARWGREVTVPAGHHVHCARDGVYYSVPWRYVGRRVQARWTHDLLEVFCDGERIASHARDASRARGDEVTDRSHMPRSHRDLLGHDSAWYRSQAAETEPSAAAPRVTSSPSLKTVNPLVRNRTREDDQDQGRPGRDPYALHRF